jgi:hypothetical protein
MTSKKKKGSVRASHLGLSKKKYTDLILFNLHTQVINFILREKEKKENAQGTCFINKYTYMCVHERPGIRQLFYLKK